MQILSWNWYALEYSGTVHVPSYLFDQIIKDLVVIESWIYNYNLIYLNKHLNLICAGYLACARCSSTGALVLTEPISTASSGDRPLSVPKTERCSNCSGAGKVRHPGQ